MKSIVYKYRISKFKRFTNGLIFAIISVIALTLCLVDISNQVTSFINIIFPFTIAIISMLMGFFTMFHVHETTKEKV